MFVNIESLGIHKLSVADRLELIEQIWDSLPPEVESGDVPERHKELLARRLASAEAEPGVGKPWREVLDSLG